MAENTIILDADVKPLRKQLREATEELQMTRQRFGDLSTEAVQAAQKVAGIRDGIAAANEQAALFDPGKRFQALTSAASLAAGAVGAVQGAMGLFGAESEETQKALLKVQSAMALSQGLSQLADLSKVTEELKSSFKGLTTTTAQKVAATTADTGAVVANTFATRAQGVVTKATALATKGATIATNLLRGAMSALFSPMGAIIVVGGLIASNFDAIKKFALNAIPGLASFGKSIMGLVQVFTDLVGITSVADRQLDAISKATAERNESIEQQIKLLGAQGGKETEIFNLKMEQSKKELADIIAADIISGEIDEERAKRKKEILNGITIDTAANNKRIADENAKAAEKQASADKTASDKAKTEKEKVDAKKLEAEKILLDAQNSLKTEREQEALAIEATFQEQSKKLKEAGIESDGALEEVRRLALQASKDKFDEQDAAKEQAFQQRLNDIIIETRIAGIKDENERARAELLNNQEQKLADLAADTTLEEDQKLILRSQLLIRNKQELDALELTFAEADAIRELESIDKEIERADISLQIEKDLLDQKEMLLKQQLAAGLISEQAFNAANEQLTKSRIDLAQKEADAKSALLQAVSQSLNVAADLVGKDTRAGKALGVASATINTFQGIAAGVKLGFPLAIPAVATAAATGFAAVKNILAVKVPGGGSVSAPNLSIPAPSTASAIPTIGTSPVTALGSIMANSPPLRAFVVESDVTGTQKRVADIERRAGF